MRPEQEWPSKDSAWAVLLLLGGCALYLTLNATLFGPIPGNVDTFAFKDAAANLALGQGFTTAFNFGNPTAAPLVYAGHPPAYAFLAGLWFSVFGVSVESNTWFEEMLRVGLTLGLWVALLPAVARRWHWLLGLLLILGLPAATTGLMYDRPDVLGLILAIVALLPLRGVTTARRALAASLLAGLALTTSPLAGTLAVSGIALQWLLAGPGRPGLLAMAAIGALGLCAPMAVLVGALALVDPSYPGRLLAFVQDAGLAGTGEGSPGLGFVSLLWRDPALLLERIRGSFTTLHHWVSLAVLGVVAVVVLWACLRARNLAALAMLGFLLFLCLVLFGWNRGYPAVVAAFLIVLLVVALPKRKTVWPLVALALAIGVSGPLTAVSLVHRVSMAQSLPRMEHWLASRGPSDVTGDGRVIVSLDPASHLLFRQAGYATLAWPQPTITLEQLLALSDAFAFGFNGSGDPTQAVYPSWWNETLGTRLYRPGLPQVPELLGYALSRSSKTWEVELWQAQPR